MTLQEFANRLDEVKIGVLISKAKEKKIDFERGLKYNLLFIAYNYFFKLPFKSGLHF